MKILVGSMFTNGATISNLRCRDETESPLWVHTQGYATRHALVSRFLVVIHYRTTPICYFHGALPWLSLLIVSEDLYVELDAIGLPSGVVQWLTFEEQVTNRNINRLQEMVGK